MAGGHAETLSKGRQIFIEGIKMMCRVQKCPSSPVDSHRIQISQSTCEGAILPSN